MNVLISISNEIYRHAKDGSEDSNDEWNAMRAIANGISIPDDATNGDVVESIFPNENFELKTIDYSDYGIPEQKIVKEGYSRYGNRTEIDADWWNSPYPERR